MRPFLTFAAVFYFGGFLASFQYNYTSWEQLGVIVAASGFAALAVASKPKKKPVVDRFTFKPCTRCEYGAPLCDGCAHNKKVIEVLRQIVEI